MSTGTVHWFNQMEDVASLLRRYHPTWNNQPTSPGDTRTWLDALLLWACLTQDLSFLEVSSATLRRWITHVARIDIVEVASVVKSVDTLILRVYGGESDERPDDVDFKHLLAEAGKEGRWVVKPIYPVVLRFLSTPSIQDFRALHQWLTFLSHISLRDIVTTAEIEKFVITDASLTVTDARVVERLRAIAHEWLHDFRITRRPRHGNGSTSEASSRDRVEKWLCLGEDELIRHAFRQEGLDIDDYLPFRGKVANRVSRLALVPKTVEKRRTICMEPAGMQFLQQMVFRSLDDHFRSRPSISTHVDLHNADRNRVLARRGSVDSSFATIDLSAASDSVLWTVAKRVFSRTPLLKWLYATRTSSVELPNGKAMGLRKFATMGSALCFPIECLIFSLVCEDTVRVMSGRHGSSYHVFGDDIVIEARFVPMVIRHLTQIGFTVNDDKSYFNSGHDVYRESCGVEAIGGHDVTPWRLSRWFHGLYVTKREPEGVNRMKDAVNTAFSRGFPCVRRMLHASFLQLPFHCRPSYSYGPQSPDDTGGPGVWTYYPQQVIRWNPSYQRREILMPAVKTVDYTPAIPDIEFLRYWNWCNAAEDSLKSLEHITLSDNKATRLTTVWSSLVPYVKR